MQLKKTILLTIVLLIISPVFSASCTYSGGVYNCDGNTCYSYADDLQGRCNCFNPDRLPTLTDPFDNQGGSGYLYLHISSWKGDAPSCPDTWCFGTGSPAFSAYCDFGYLDCLDTGGNINSANMGCETSCNQCNSNSDCSALNTNDLTAVCGSYDNSNCKFCYTVSRSCGPSDGYCPSNCYLDQDPDCLTCRTSYCPSSAGAMNQVIFDQAGSRLCICPICFSNADCGEGRTCANPGTYNAYCAYNVGAGVSTAFTATNVFIGESSYDVLVYERVGENKLLADIYPYESGRTGFDFSTVLYPRITSGSYFLLDGQNYRIFFTAGSGDDNELKIFKVSFYTRLTYNIFPVCGNSVCEICEDSSNCLSYPPESCLSCPTDCPYVTTDELDAFNSIIPVTNYKFSDLITDSDKACQVKTQDKSSVCNPLCVTHEFIDANGCLFKRYGNSLPMYANGTIMGRDETTVSYYFNNKDYNLYFSNEGSFLGTGDGYENVLGAGNALCTDDCECFSSHCDKNNEAVDVRTEEGYGHCCPSGFEWSDTDNVAGLYCTNGRVKQEYLGFFEDINFDNYIDSTQSFIDARTIDNTKAKKVSDYICTGVNDKLSCEQGYDPFCVYSQSSSYEVIQPNGVYQCRRIVEATQNIMSGITCTIHTHAWAKAGCNERDIFTGCADQGFLYLGDSMYGNYFCVTDNVDECASAESLRLIKGNSGYVLKTITYQEFCETPALVCESANYLTNSQKLDNIGGTIDFTNCQQDAFAYSDLFSSNHIGYLPMTVAYYCSLFGNNFDTIFNVDEGNLYKLTNNDADGTLLLDMNLYSPIMGQFGFSGGFFYTSSSREVGLGDWGYVVDDGSSLIRIRYPHMPMIDRDDGERTYHYLWNYESCAEFFPETVADCTGITANTVTVRDENGDPTHPFIGTYAQPIIQDDMKQYVKSRSFCEELWSAYEATGSTYNWNSPANIPSLTVKNTQYSSAQINNIISTSCIYWYEPFLDAYYSSAPANQLESVTEINPPMYQWGRTVTRTHPCFTDGCIPTSSTSYELFDLDFIRDKTYCDSGTGLVKPGLKCRSDYPTSAYLNENQNCNLR
ncbi:MAG: hypothetical protein JW791_01000 [Nanoarchaeota archaeon]|nr:hypothetical protein [Nanoarchaeota archaeon]